MAYVVDISVRIPACASSSYLIAGGYFDSNLTFSLERVGKENCLSLQVFYAIAILWAVAFLIELDRINWGWDMHLHHFSAVIAYGFFVDGSSSLHTNQVYAGFGLLVSFGIKAPTHLSMPPPLPSP